MDSLTHIFSGALVGELVLGRKVGRKAMFWGAVAANLPDLDSIAYLFVNDVEALWIHRGLSHSIFTAILLGPLIGWILSLVYKSSHVHASLWMFMITLNLIIHNFLDTCTAYGTGLLEPFVSTRYSIHSIFILDPVFTLPLLISFIALLILRNDSSMRRKWISGGLALSTLYLMLTFFNRATVSEITRYSIHEKEIKYEEFIVTPTILNSILWNIIVKDTGGFYIGYYSLLDRDRDIELHYFPRKDYLLESVGSQDEVSILKRFAQGYYIISRENTNTWFNDLRFGQVRGWEKPDAPFAFAFNLTAGGDNSDVVQRGRIEGSKRAALKSLWRRMMHNEY